MFLSIKQVAARYGIDPCTVWRWRKDANKNFPEPHRFGPQTLRWKLSDIETWEEAAK